MQKGWTIKLSALVADKFRGCAELAKWPHDKAGSVIDLVNRIETAKDLTRLVAMLTT